MDFVPCMSWIKRGAAKAHRDQVVVTQDELKTIIDETKMSSKKRVSQLLLIRQISLHLSVEGRSADGYWCPQPRRWCWHCWSVRMWGLWWEWYRSGHVGGNFSCIKRTQNTSVGHSTSSWGLFASIDFFQVLSAFSSRYNGQVSRGYNLIMDRCHVGIVYIVTAFRSQPLRINFLGESRVALYERLLIGWIFRGKIFFRMLDFVYRLIPLHILPWLNIRITLDQSLCLYSWPCTYNLNWNVPVSNIMLISRSNRVFISM